MGDFFDGQENDQQTDGPKALREAYEKQKAVAAELTERLAKLEQRERTRAVETLLPPGVNPGIAKFYDGDAEPEKFKAWFEENKNLFGLKPADSTEQPTGTQVQSPGTELETGLGLPPQEWRDAMARTTAGEAGTQDVTKFASEIEKANQIFQQAGGNVEAALQALGGGL